MKTAAAIIEAVADLKTIERQVQKAHIAVQDADKRVTADEQRCEASREQLRQARVELGRKLVEARGLYKHGEWLPFLERCGIPQRSAHDWMALAGYVERKLAETATSANLNPTNRDAGIERRPLKSEKPKIVEDDEKPDLPRVNDLDRALLGIHKTMMGYAKTWPRRSRVELAKTLRSLASEIEAMGSESED